MAYPVRGGRMVAVSGGRRIQADPVGFWLSRLEETTRRNVRGDLDRFIRWLHTQPDWVSVDARSLLQQQLDSYADDPYVILNLLQTYISGCKFAKSTNKRNYSAIRSFFLHNRVPLPDDPSYRVPGYRPPTVGKLTVTDIAEIAAAARVRDRSLILVKWQGLLDTESVMWIGRHKSDELVDAIRRDECPILIDLPGRKHGKNEKTFYTWIGRDAIDALVRYFEHERGWPKKAEAIWLNQYGRPMTARTWCELWAQITRRIGKVPKERAKDSSARYGYNTHEMRDVARSLLHVKGQPDGLDEISIEFFMGHEVDPLHYNKFFLDKEYTRKQYQIAEKYLNIISNPQISSAELQKRDRELTQLREKYDSLGEKHDQLEEMVQKIVSGEFTPPKIK